MKKVLNWKVLIVLLVFIAGIFMVNSIYADSTVTCEECESTEYITVSTTAATCTTNKIIEYTCTNPWGGTDGGHLGGEYTFIDEIDGTATGHVYTFEQTKEPTCLEYGEITQTCINEGCEEVITSQIPMIAHSPSTEAVYGKQDVLVQVSINPPFYWPGHEKITKCTQCNETLSVENEIHLFDYKCDKEATCTENGRETGTCDCKLEDTRDISATGHTEYVIYEDANDEQYHVIKTYCTTCGISISSSLEHHSSKNYVYNNDATCTEDGTETGNCICGAEVTRTKEGSKINHAEYNVRYVAVDELGHSFEKICTICGVCFEYFMESHIYEDEEYEYDENATCTADGTESRDCVCGYSDTRTIEGSKLAHSQYYTEYDQADEYHVVHMYCGVCDTEFYTEQVEHTYTDYTYNNDSTCTEDGTETGTCICGAIHTRTEGGSKISHDIYKEYSGQNGVESHVVDEICKICGDVIAGGYESHTYGNYQDNNDATCTTDGTETGKCVCGKTDTRTKTGTKLNHTYSNYQYNNDETCTADGTETGTCVCGKTDTRTAEGSKTGHSFGEWVIDKPATYEEDGHKYRLCTFCETEKEEQTIPKLTIEEFEVSTELNTKEKDGKTYIQMTTTATIQEILNSITANKELEVVDKNGNVLEGTANVGTGAKVIQKETKEEVYTLVVCGDITGDGKISIAELAVASKMAVNSPTGINDLQFMALDVSKDEKITISDLAALSRLMTKQLFR